ncbi:hypothetical protein [Deinococcus hopiensis]|uniref:hypothetical protein n=1 Tax=Deinococcus hopiensis TaxID=309885 RepID=UPI00148377FA|nr:hypothetical protein [Deinococcus hopiensis]
MTYPQALDHRTVAQKALRAADAVGISRERLRISANGETVTLEGRLGTCPYTSAYGFCFHP